MKLQRGLIIASVLMLVALGVTFAGNAPEAEKGVAISAVDVAKSAVFVTLDNASNETRTVQVRVLVVVDGASMASLQTVQLSPKSESGAAFTFGADVSELIDAGLIDGGDPL